MKPSYRDKELVEVLCGEDAGAADELLEACAEDGELRQRVRQLVALDAMLRSLSQAQPSATPSPELLARYLHASESLTDEERVSLRLQLALQPQARAELAAMRRFSAPAAELEDLPEIATAPAPLEAGEARRGLAWHRDLRVRLAAIALALGLPLFAYAGYSAWQSARGSSQPELAAARSPAGQPLQQRAPDSTAEDNTLFQSQRLSSGEALRLPVEANSALELSVLIDGLGVTNPDLVCELLAAGPWLPDAPAGAACSEARLVALFRAALSTALAPPLPDQLSLPERSAQVRVLRVRQTQDGRLRLRSEVDFDQHASWPMHAAFIPQPASRATGSTGETVLQFESALFIDPQVCDWAELEGLGICQMYSRFMPTLIKHLSPNRVWQLQALRWNSDIRLQATVRAHTDGDSQAQTLLVEMDDELHPHWTVIESFVE